MATSYSNEHIISYTTLDTAPDRYSTLTGTMTTVGLMLTGSATLFLTEIGGDRGVGSPSNPVEGGWIFNGADEVRQIRTVIDNTHIVLTRPFSVDIVAARVVRYVQPSRTMQMSWLCIGAGGKVDNVTLAANESSGAGYTASTPNRTVNPIVIDGSTGQINVTIFQAN